jgi:hypothetical protein
MCTQNIIWHTYHYLSNVLLFYILFRISTVHPRVHPTNQKEYRPSKYIGDYLLYCIKVKKMKETI